MSAPFIQLGPPPLPPGWTEHLGPGGQVYFFNAHTQQSTYVRPLPAFPVVQQQPAKKREKPLVKTPIPGTEWIRVKTTEGNTFYSHKVKKQSIWTVPEEIKDAVDSLERDERVAEEKARLDEIAKKEADARRVEEEVARVKSEVQDIVKRKAEDPVPVDEVIITKKAKVEDEDEDDEEDDGEESEEEEWQREAAAQLAAEAEEEKKRQEEEAERLQEELKEAEKARASSQINMPERVDLSLEEAKALFKTLLREKDINPLHPWDTSLPKFVSDPRYVLLPSVSARKEAFDEYCRDRARELRQSVVKKEKEAANPKEEYERLLKEEVKSTRTSWTDFRRTWKKDRRFFGWGRDDREREKRFRDFVRDLGEKKRAAAQKAEADFFTLLREHKDLVTGSIWKDVKRKLVDDPRYDAVGSSSLREELFNTFLKGTSSASTSAVPMPDSEANAPLPDEDTKMGDVDEAEQKRIQQERKERALKEREEKVRAERGRVEVDIGRSKVGIYKEEGERDFKVLLTDAIRDPQITWDAALPQLKTDPRFRNSPLPANQQLHLFHAHVSHLRTRHIDALHALFEAHAPSLATAFESLPLPSLLSSLPVVKLGFDIQALEHEFEKWQRERTTVSRLAFDEMLTENAFVEFWGRLGKIGGKGVDGGLAIDDLEGEDAAEDGETKVDMKALAKNVDVQDMEKVLKNDKRYIMFDHVPEQRERWIRDYISRLSAPKLSVHVPQSSS